MRGLHAGERNGRLVRARHRLRRRRLHLREISQDSELPTTSVGATLRLARLERGDDVAATAAALKLRRDQLEAIEEDDLSRLPGRTYALGFVRSYARHLGLDSDALVEQFKDENADQDIDKPVNLIFPEAAEEKRLPNGSILILALVIAMVIYGISYLTLPRSTTATVAKAEESPVVVDPAPTAARAAQPVAPKAIAAPAPLAPAAAPTSFVTGTVNLPEQALPAAVTQPSQPAGSLSAPAIVSAPNIVVAQVDTPPPSPAVSATRPPQLFTSLPPTTYKPGY